MVELIISFTIGFITGNIYWLITSRILRKQQILSKKKDIKNQFNQVLENLKKGKSQFKTRIKNTILIETTLIDFGKVGLICFLDKKQISIFKEEKCLYSTEELEDIETVEEISSMIKKLYNKEINDVVDIMGISVSRTEFERNFNQQLKEFKIEKETNEINSIINENIKKLDIDEILDKISKNGLESLSNEELDYLKKYK